MIKSVDCRMKTRGSTSKYTEAFNLEIWFKDYVEDFQVCQQCRIALFWCSTLYIVF